MATPVRKSASSQPQVIPEKLVTDKDLKIALAATEASLTEKITNTETKLIEKICGLELKFTNEIGNLRTEMSDLRTDLTEKISKTVNSATTRSVTIISLVILASEFLFRFIK